MNSEAWDLVSTMSQQHWQRVKTINFIYYRPIHGILERLRSESDAKTRAVFLEAASIRDAGTDRRHFFEIALSLAISEGVGKQVIEEILKEPDPGTRVLAPIDIDGSCLRELLEREKSVSPRDEVFALVSKCTLINGKEAHLPMMDFILEPSPQSLKLVTTAMKSISPRGGVVLQSGRSYHFYGTELLDPVGWLKFLGKSLLFQGLTDDRYIGHRLREGFCVLRISRGPSQDTVPFVEETW